MGSFKPRRDDRPPIPGPPPVQAPPPPATAQDEEALARYRYLLQTAPPEAIEQAHAEAFARLTPEQRRLVLQRLSEQGAPLGSDQPLDLARSASWVEARQPGFMERTFAGPLLGGLAGYVLGSMVANQFYMNPLYGVGFTSMYPDFGGWDYGAFGDDFPDDGGMDQDQDFGPGPDDYNQDPLGDPADDGGLF